MTDKHIITGTRKSFVSHIDLRKLTLNRWKTVENEDSMNADVDDEDGTPEKLHFEPYLER